MTLHFPANSLKVTEMASNDLGFMEIKDCAALGICGLSGFLSLYSRDLFQTEGSEWGTSETAGRDRERGRNQWLPLWRAGSWVVRTGYAWDGVCVRVHS